MSGASLTSPFDVPSHDRPAALEPLNSLRSRWPFYLSLVLSVLLFGGLARELMRGGLDGLKTAMPTSLSFYCAFVAIYAVQPLADYAIFRRLWNMPIAGIIPILRKLVANEVLLGYSGEAYFYAWARARLNMVAAPFAAIKDVSILSAVVGNLFTLSLLGIATPLAFEFLPVDLVKPVLGSGAFIVAISLAIVLFRGRLFSLRRDELRWVLAVHIVRTLAYTVLLALCWHLALPDVPLAIWMILVTSRQLVARLPLVPNKDIVFANLAIVLVGDNLAVTQLIALTVALTLLCHAVVLIATWLPPLKRSIA